jgi:cation:H+ antiporter
VRHSVHLAAALKIPSIVIGLTIVSIGTSTPELFTNIIALSSGNTDIALGNIVGSNIFNVLFILGLSALICPLLVHRQVIRFDVPVMILASLMLWAFSLYGSLGIWVGLSFLSFLLIYIASLLYTVKDHPGADEFKKEYSLLEKFSYKMMFKHIIFIVLSLVLMVIGSKFLIEGVVRLAEWIGISELIISLTIVAAGTSLPELATSVVAALRGERDIAVGNIVGSNIFNIWGILGVSALITPIPINTIMLDFDIPVMCAVAIGCLPIFLTGHTIYRWEGLLFLFYYGAYLTHIIMEATNHHWLNNFQDAMIFFFFPLTVISLLIGLVNHFRNPKSV